MNEFALIQSKLLFYIHPLEQWSAHFVVALGFHIYIFGLRKKTFVELSHYYVQHMWLIYLYNRA